MKRVAIVVVTHNSALEIRGCLDSLAGLSDVEVVVVDNNSADNTCARISTREIHLIKNPTNIGFAAAVNQGVRATNAEFVLLLNPDAQLLRGLDALIARCSESG